jgi:hypothetical protein
MPYVDQFRALFAKFRETRVPGYNLSYEKKYKSTIAAMAAIIARASECGQIIFGLDQYVTSRSSQKNSARNVVLAFYETVDAALQSDGAAYRVGEISVLPQTQVFDFPLLRNLEMLKFLHGRAASSAEIAEHFQVDARTIRRSIGELQQGVKLFSTKIKVTAETCPGRERPLRYKSSVHPLFLALNLTEIFTLLQALQTAAQDAPYKDHVYQALFNDVAGQLSVYARDIIAKAGLELPPLPGGSVYRDEEESVRCYFDYALRYLLKSGKKITVTYHDESNQSCQANGYIDRITENILYLRPDSGKMLSIDLTKAVFDLKSIAWS